MIKQCRIPAIICAIALLGSSFVDAKGGSSGGSSGFKSSFSSSRSSSSSSSASSSSKSSSSAYRSNPSSSASTIGSFSSTRVQPAAIPEPALTSSTLAQSQRQQNAAATYKSIAGASATSGAQAPPQPISKTENPSAPAPAINAGTSQSASPSTVIVHHDSTLQNLALGYVVGRMTQSAHGAEGYGQREQTSKDQISESGVPDGDSGGAPTIVEATVGSGVPGIFTVLVMVMVTVGFVYFVHRLFFDGSTDVATSKSKFNKYKLD